MSADRKQKRTAEGGGATCVWIGIAELYFVLSCQRSIYRKRESAANGCAFLRYSGWDYFTATTTCAVLLAAFRSCVRAEVLMVLVRCAPEAAMARSLRTTVKLWPFSRRVLWQTTLPEVAPMAGVEHEVAVLLTIPAKLQPLGIASVRTTASLPSGPKLLTRSV